MNFLKRLNFLCKKIQKNRKPYEPVPLPDPDLFFSPDVTVIIAGPLSRITLDRLHWYQRFAKVFVSCWLEDDVSQIPEGVEYRQWGQPRDYPGGSYQCVNRLNAIRSVTTDNVVILRSDEYYIEIDKIIENTQRYPDKLTVNNIFFRPNNQLTRFSASDHVHAGSRELLENTYLKAYQILYNIHMEGRASIEWQSLGINLLGHLCPEQLLTYCFLRSKGVSVNPECSKEIMREHINLIPFRELDGFATCNSCVNKKHITEESELPDWNGKSILSWDDL